MNKKVYFAFILGLTAGLLNVLFAVAAGLPQDSGQIFTLLVIDAACLLSLIGACICKRKRVLGGAFMGVSAAFILTCVVWGITSPVGSAVFKMLPEVFIAIIVTELVSITAAILCFTPEANKLSEYYYEHGTGLPDLSVPAGEDTHVGDIVNNLYNKPDSEQISETDNTKSA